jgi:hypothetical protein
VRDVVFYGKHTFGEFLASEERITTSVLADRLATLVRTGVLAKERSATRPAQSVLNTDRQRPGVGPDPRRARQLGCALRPGGRRQPLWVDKARTDREGLCRLIRDTVSAGAAVFRGENSVIKQLAQMAPV